MNRYALELEVGVSIAKKAGAIMWQYFDGDQQTKIKSDGSPVTIADIEINAMVLQELATAFPHDGVVGEEASSADTTQDRLWFCDPIDGTQAFTWGTPTAMFSLGLVVGSEAVVGIAYDPFLDRMYTAIRGQGSQCNGRQLQVSSLGLDDGIVAAPGNIRQLVLEPPTYVRKLVDQNVRLASFSGAVYKSCLVAQGKMVGYIEGAVNPHDMAAVDVVVTEAGGHLCGMDGKPLNYRTGFKGAIVANSPALARQLLA